MVNDGGSEPPLFVQVTITKTTFAKPCNYFISLQMNGDEKVRTEVSPPSPKPEFSKAEFKFPVANQFEGPHLVTLGAFVVLAGKDSTKGNAKLLGQCTLDVQNLSVQLLRGETVACNLVFTRKPKPDKEISVGRMQVMVHLVDVGDGVMASNSAHPDTRACCVLVHCAHALPLLAEGRRPDSIVEVRIASQAAQLAYTEVEEAIAARADMAGGGRDAMRAKAEADEDIKSKRAQLAKVWPKALGATRTIALNTSPSWNEMVLVEVSKRSLDAGKLLRIDIVDAHSVEWRSFGGGTVPLATLQGQRQYNLALELPPGPDTAAPQPRVFVSVLSQSSLNEQLSRFRENSKLQRVEVSLRSLSQALPFKVHQVCAVATLVGHEYAKDFTKRLRGDGAVADSDFWGSHFESCPFKFPDGADLSCVQRDSLDGETLQSTRRVTLGSTTKTNTPKWEFTLTFDVGGQRPRGVSHYPSDVLFGEPGTGPAWLFVEFYERGETYVAVGEGGAASSNDDSMKAEYEVAHPGPGRRIAYAALQFPSEDVPTDGTPMAFDTVPVHVYVPRNGGFDGEPIEGAKLSLTLRLWDALSFLRQLEEGDPTQISATAVQRWANASKEASASKRSLRSPDTKVGAVIDAARDEAKSRADGDGDDNEGSDPLAGLGSRRGSPSPVPSRATGPSPAPSSQGGGASVAGASTGKASRGSHPPTDHSSLAEPLEEGSLRSDVRYLRPGDGGTAHAAMPQVDGSELRLLHERMAVLTSDIAHKQTLIDRLMKEVDKRSEAIRNCGVEIVELRRQNKHLGEERDELRGQLEARDAEARAEADVLADTTNLSNADASSVAELQRRVLLLAQKYGTERKRNEEIMRRLHAQVRLHAQSLSQRELAGSHEKLERAHQAQAQYIQKLQEDNSKIGVYKSTIKTQEKVIAKLEDLMESKLRSRGSSGDMVRVRAELTRVTKRNQDLERMFLSGEHIDGGMAMRVKELESQLRDAGGSGSGANDASLQQRDVKIRALEEQMVENAQKFAKEISAANFKIMELEAQLPDPTTEYL